MSQVDDWELVARAQAGDMGSFGDLVARYQTPITHFCLRMAGSKQDAEDLAQETFVRLYRHLHRVAPQAKFSTMLFGIARNLTLNHLRDSKRRGRGVTQPLEGQALAERASERPDEQARLAEIAAALEQGIAQLSEDHREVLVLREIQGMDYEGIAKVLKCRKGTVKSRLARAREQLRLRLMALGADLL